MEKLPEASERRVCRVLEVSRSSVHLNKLGRAVRRKPFIDEKLAEKIHELQAYMGSATFWIKSEGESQEGVSAHETKGVDGVSEEGYA